jgi:hypothetical protein
MFVSTLATVPLPRPLGADEHQDLLLTGVGRQGVAEELLEQAHGLRVAGPELVEELEPLAGLVRLRVVVVVDAVGGEE